jgi:hypothetical protein
MESPSVQHVVPGLKIFETRGPSRHGATIASVKSFMEVDPESRDKTRVLGDFGWTIPGQDSGEVTP